MKRVSISVFFLLFFWISTKGQDTLQGQLKNRYFSQIGHKASRFEHRITRSSERMLARLLRAEKKMQARLQRIDAGAARIVFAESIDSLSKLKAAFKGKLLSGVPAGAYLDTVGNTLKFLGKDNSSLSLKNATRQVDELQGKLQMTEQVRAYIQEHKQQLKAQLAQYTGFTKDLQRLNKQAYYYGAQFREYQTLFEDRKKVEAKALTLLRKLPAYNKFLEQNSLLAGLFNLPADYNAARSLEGLQTRTQVEQLVQQRLGTDPGARQIISQQLDAARARFDDLKNEFSRLDNAAEMPEFKPREMKVKRFLNRLEPGGNIQFQKSNQYFPVTADLAAQVAYKFHKSGSAGIGLMYKIGMGTGWNNIQFSEQGFGLRSFVDWKLKGSFFLNGGYERNLHTAVNTTALFKDNNIWTASALIGISKKYKITSKLKGNILVLYDFLAPRQLPKTNNFKVRFGYSM